MHYYFENTKVEYRVKDSEGSIIQAFSESSLYAARLEAQYYGGSVYEVTLDLSKGSEFIVREVEI